MPNNVLLLRGSTSVEVKLDLSRAMCFMLRQAEAMTDIAEGKKKGFVALNRQRDPGFFRWVTI